MPTDTLAHNAALMLETRAAGIDVLREAQLSLGSRVRSLLDDRGFPSVAALVAATNGFAASGHSGYASIDQLLRDSQWDGRHSLFLGCYRWQAPSGGLSCSWSGPTPLQLVGLVDDPAQPGLGSFSILYARSAAV